MVTKPFATRRQSKNGVIKLVRWPGVTSRRERRVFGAVRDPFPQSTQEKEISKQDEEIKHFPAV
jgi:hypothetical protein